MLKALRADPEYPALAKFYEEFVSRLFSEVPEHEELHTDVGSYDESLSPRLTPEEWSNLRPGSVVVSTQGRYEILRAVANPNPGAEVKVNYLARSNPPAKNEPPEKHIFYSLGRWHLETVEHEELHTDVSGYDEGLHREIEKLTEAKEVIIDARALEAAIAWARETFRQTISMDHGPRRALTFHFCAPEDLFTTFKVKPSASVKFQFDRLSNGEEYLTSIIVRYIRPEAYRGGDLEIGIVDIVEGYPIPATWEELETEILHKYGPGTGAPRTMAPHKFMRAFRRLKFFPTIREAFEGFIERLFEPVGHEELHTDTGSYEEAAIDPASVRMADYELLRKYGRIPRESLPGLPASPSQNDAPGEEEA
jgi:hypothetical protein